MNPESSMEAFRRRGTWDSGVRRDASSSSRRSFHEPMKFGKTGNSSFIPREPPALTRRSGPQINHPKPVRKIQLDAIKTPQQIRHSLGSPNNHLEKMEQQKKLTSKVTLSEGLRQTKIEMQDLRTRVDDLTQLVEEKEKLIIVKDAEIRRRKEGLRMLRERYEEKVTDPNHLKAMRAEARKAEHGIEQINTTLEFTKEQLAHVKKQLENKASKLAISQSALEGKDEQIERLRENLKTQITEYGGLLNDYNKSLERIENLEKTIKQQEPKLSQQEELVHVKQHLKELESEVENVRKRNNTLESELENTRDKLYATENAHMTEDKESEAEVSRMRLELSEKNTTIQSHLKTLKQAQMIYQKERRDIEAALEKSEVARVALQTQVSKFENVRKSLERAEKSRELLQKQVDSLVLGRASDAEKLKDLREKYETAEEKTQVLSKSGEDKLSKLTAQLKESISLQTAANETIQSLKSQLQTQSEEIDSQTAKAMSLSQINETLQASLCEWKSNCESLEQEVAGLKLEAESKQNLQNKLDLAQVDSDRVVREEAEKRANLEKRNKSLQNELQTSRAETEAVREECVQLSKLLTEIKATVQSYTTTRSKLEAENRTTSQSLKLLQDELEKANEKFRSKEKAWEEKHTHKIASIRSELDTECIKWKSKVSSLEKQLAERSRAFEDLQKKANDRAKDLELFRTTLNTATTDVDNLQRTITDLRSNAQHVENVKALLTSLKEEMSAHKAVLNLKLLLKAADTTDATTYLEFSRIREKSMDEQMQVLVYNITACESHMAVCDPAATKKQQVTRQRRIEKIQSNLSQSESHRDDYLATSKANRERLGELLNDAQNKLSKAQSHARDLIVKELGSNYN